MSDSIKMQKNNTEQLQNKLRPRILVVPLDWGLGHATRCISIIKELELLNCEVWLAGEGAQEVLLKKEFLHLPFLSLPGYRARYAATSAGFLFRLLTQLPAIFKAIKNENQWLQQKVKEHGFDAVISDSRFGLFHKNIPCVFITHQLNIKSPLGKWSEKILQRWNYHFINRFSECWVPDDAGDNNLAGELSHPNEKPEVPVKYIGAVSRFESSEQKEENKLLVLLSGPESQRTLLEKKILLQLKLTDKPVIIVRGLPDSKDQMKDSGSVKFYNHLSSAELNRLIEASEWVIGRCGYSTVMDLMKLKKKSILIPTPGQTEQEYLAKYLMHKQYALCFPQHRFSLAEALQEARSFSYRFPSNDAALLTQTIRQFVKSLSGSL